MVIETWPHMMSLLIEPEECNRDGWVTGLSDIVCVEKLTEKFFFCADVSSNSDKSSKFM